MWSDLKDLPPCTVTTSPRAKRVRLRMTMHQGLFVVLPRSFDRRRLPQVLEEKRDWINRATARMDSRRSALPGHLLSDRPEQVHLLAVGQAWTVVYRPADGQGVALREQDDHRLVLQGCTTRGDLVRSALRGWALAKGRGMLLPWLERLAARHGFSYARTSIRAQRSLWGSLSTRGTLSLNCKLLFLPGELTEYVLLHELCHTRHLDHSPRFWSLLQQLDPDWEKKRKALRGGAWQYVPAWLA